MSDMLVVKAKIKDVAEKYKTKDNVNVAGDFAEALSKKVEELIKDACRRAGANDRVTISARDL